MSSFIPTDEANALARDDIDYTTLFLTLSTMVTVV
jgi:hypothetical protein